MGRDEKKLAGAFQRQALVARRPTRLPGLGQSGLQEDSPESTDRIE